MKVKEFNGRVKCDLGACRNRATHVVEFERNRHANIYVCDKCMSELYDAIGEAILPKSVETAKPKNAKKEGKK